MTRKIINGWLIGFLLVQMACSTQSCDLVNFKNHALNFDQYMKLREKIVQNESIPDMSSNCLSELLYCCELNNDKNLANSLNIMLSKKGKAYWARMFEIIAKDIDDRNGLLQDIRADDIPSDRDHIKVIFSLCDLEDIVNIKDSIAKTKLLPYYNEYLGIIEKAKKSVLKTCANCPKSLSDYHFCDAVSTELQLLNYYQNAYKFTKENEDGCYSGMANLSIWQFKYHILQASLNSWHHKDTEKYRQDAKEKLKVKDYNERGLSSVESSFLMVSVFLGKEIVFSDPLTEYTVEGLKIPVLDKHKIVVQRLKEAYDRQMKIKEQDFKLDTEHRPRN